MIKRLFIIYSNVDRNIAKEVRDQLAEAGYDVWIAHMDIKGAVDWTQSILDAIDSRDGMVLVWSESAARSHDVREEIRLARVFYKPIFPVLAYPQTKILSLPEEIRTLQVIEFGSIDLNIAELKARLDDPIKSNIQYAELVKNGFIPKAPNPYFVGRSRELKNLFVDSRGYHGLTKQGIPIAISGLAGIGKTQLALAFGYRFNLFFPDGVYWVDVPNGIVHEFGKIGLHLGVKRLQDERPSDYAIRVLEKLGQLREGLIIFDDVTNFSEFRQWCPTGNTSCSVILTTRLSPRGFPARVMNLTELDLNSAFELLVARRKDGEEISRDKVQREALEDLCRITGNHPLALELCASRLQSEFIKPSDYLKDIQSDPLGRLSDETKSDVSLDWGIPSLAEVLHHSYTSLDEKLVDRYFLLMCCFAPYGINEELIVHAYENPGDGGRALDQLYNISFIRRELPNSLSLHPLVAQFGRDLQKQKDFDYSGKFVEVMLGFLRSHENNLASEDVLRQKPHIDEALRVAQDKELWEACAQLHEYEAVIESSLREQIDSLDQAYRIIEQHLPQQKRRLPGLRLQLGRAHRMAGRLHEALDDFDQVAVLYGEVEGVDPAETASLYFELGDTLLALGRYAEAEKILSDALKEALTYLDPSAPEVLQLRRALARHALYLGNYDVAEAGFTEILGYRKNFFTVQPDATSAAGLSSAYADLSRLALARTHYADAIQAANDALMVTKEYYSESDPDCSHLYLLLGAIHCEAGYYSRAEEQLDKAYRDFLVTFGERHPSYARALIALGEVHRRQGKFYQAEMEVESAIEIFERVYGVSHPFVAEALEVQGMIYDHRCEFDKEQMVWERILKIQYQFYSEQHPALANTYYNYANLFLRRGEYDKAAEHLQASLWIIERSSGKTRSDYFRCLVRLARCRYEQQDYWLAQRILDEAKTLHPDIFEDYPHPFIARMLQLQSEILRQLGRFAEALETIDQTIAMKEAIYGTEDHPSVAEALEVKVKIFHYLGKTDEAKVLIDRTLEIRRKAYGDYHPQVSNSIHDLGSYYLRLGQYEVAVKQFEQARQITVSVFGKEHPDYVEHTLDLANARYQQGEYQLALGLLEEVKDALPDGNHYLTARWLQLLSDLQQRLGRFGKAMDYIDQAIAMKTAIYGKDHPSVAEALEVKAKIFDHLEESDEAKLLIDRTLKIRRKAYGENHPEVSRSIHDLGSYYLRLGQYEAAIEQFERARQITVFLYGVHHPDYIEQTLDLVNARNEQGDAQLALSLIEDLLGSLIPRLYSDELAYNFTDIDWRLTLMAGRVITETDIHIKNNQYFLRIGSMSNVRDWLRALVNGGYLTQTDREVAKQALESLKTVSTDLAGITKKYLSRAGFEVQQNDVDSFLCSPIDEFRRFGKVYVRVISGREPRRKDIEEIMQQSQKWYSPNLANRVAFIIIDHSLDLGAHHQMSAYRSDNRFIIVPLYVSQLRQALQTDSCSIDLNSTILECQGKTDLYDAHRPQTDGRQFYGRQQLIETIQDSLDQGEHVAVFGLRKMGKSSLMYYLHDKLPYPMVVLNLLAVHRLPNIYYETISGWSSVLAQRLASEQIPELVLMQNRRITNVEEAFRSDTEKLLECMRECGIPSRLVLCLDEIDLIYPPKAQPVLSSTKSRNLMGFLRGVADQLKTVNLIVCGMRADINQDADWGGKSNPVFHAFKEILLGPFSEKENDEMVQSIGADMGISYDEDALQYLYKESGGHPYITRQMCSLAVNKAGWPHTQITKDHIAFAASDYPRNHNTMSYIEGELWKGLHDRIEKQLLKNLASRQPQTDGELIPASLSVSQKATRVNALSKMCERRLLNLNSDGYVIAYNCYRRWIRLNQLGESEDA